jgi:hypothetical protein
MLMFAAKGEDDMILLTRLQHIRKATVVRTQVGLISSNKIKCSYTIFELANMIFTCLPGLFMTSNHTYGLYVKSGIATIYLEMSE